MADDWSKNDRRTVVLVAGWQVVAFALTIAAAWFARRFLSPDELRAVIVLALGLLLFYPARYRFEKEPKARYIRIPFLFVGLCELAIVIFDRFKPPSLPADESKKQRTASEGGAAGEGLGDRSDDVSVQ